MFTISVCMIVKNESKTLERVLKCIKQFADEIIIVDTGSCDNTKEIAKKYTDNIFDFVWQNDFSKARNFAFSKASKDYQMWLDADDVITKENIEKINKLKTESGDVDVYMCKYSIGFDQLNVPYLTYYRERILKRSKKFMWQGFVHEVIAPSGTIEYTDIEIEHRKINFGNPKRNLKLYQNAIKSGHELEPRELYYYARELFYNGYFTKAIRCFRKFLKLENTFSPDHLGAFLMLCDCYTAKNELEKAEDVMFEALKQHIPTSEMCCKLGNIYDLQNKKERAIFWYNNALSCEKQKEGFVRKDYSDIIPYLELCKLHYQTKNFEKAKEFHLKAKETRPNHPSVLYNEKFFKD